MHALLALAALAQLWDGGGYSGMQELRHNGSAFTQTGDAKFNDNVQLEFGSSSDTVCEYDTAVTPDAMVCGLGSDSRVWYIAEAADVGTDWAKAQQTNPTLCVQSADATTVADRVCLAHNQTDGVISTDAGGLSIVPAGGDVTVTGNISTSTATGPALRDAAGGSTGAAGGLLPDKSDTDTVISFDGARLNAIVNNVWTFAVTSSQVNARPGVTLLADGALVCGNAAVTCADNGNGGTAAACSLTTSDVRCAQILTCEDAQGCNYTLDETSAQAGAVLFVVNTSANTANFADSAGVQETASPALGQYDSVSFIYAGSTWIQMTPVQNN